MIQALFGRAKNRLQRVLRLKSVSVEEVRSPETEPDRALVISITAPKKIPGLSQLRNSYRILSSKEQKVAFAALAIFILSLGTAFIALASSHWGTTPTSGGALSEALVGQPKFINPIDAVANDVDRDLVKLVYSGLFKYQGLESVPDMAKDYAWSDDRKTLTVHLKPNIFFHDGVALTTEDVLFTLDTLQDPAHKSPVLPLYRNIKASAPDQSTVIFELDKPDVNFLSKLTIGIMPAHLWQELPSDSLRLSDLNLKPVGSGPFKIKSFTRDNLGNIHSYTLEKFDKYYGTKPFIKTVSFQFFADRKQASEAFKTGLVDSLAFNSAGDAARLTGAQNKLDVRLELPNETVAFFNLKRKPLQSKEVRTALALAVDRSQLLESQNITAQPVAGPFPFASDAPPKADLEQARKILDLAGWVLPENGNVRHLAPKKPEPTKGKKTVAITTPTPTASTTELAVSIVVPDEPDLVNAAEGLKRQWSLLGVKVEIIPVSMDEVLRRATRERSADVVLLNVYLGPDQDLFPFWWSGQTGDRGLNFSGLSDRSVDDALEKVRNATSSEALPALQKALTQSIQTTVSAVFLARPVQHYLVHSRIKGVNLNPLIAEPADRFDDLTNWYVKTWFKWK
ncbi:MAG: ABC transporter substrate-binding protein [Patescibacteria group bacterium]